ncbi:hypothetical protein [Xanthobacter wiegelii]|uniref:hypothetical protein n=1 Tax=Xanthobacter wiegelii TaxID=3119913 RepID=UPI00372A161F
MTSLADAYSPVSTTSRIIAAISGGEGDTHLLDIGHEIVLLLSNGRQIYYQGQVEILPKSGPLHTHLQQRCRQSPWQRVTAIRCGAQHIVTANLANFPDHALEAVAIKAIDTDEFLSMSFDLYPAEALATLNVV